MLYGTRAPKELLHHLPASVLRRPTEVRTAARYAGGMRGSRMRDRRPPTYRCPAVPGLTSYARAILMALNSSVLPSEPITCQNRYCELLIPLLLLYCGYSW
ncbi:hypothetical protein Save01_08415 [Streptomyces avermitilis]|uniref:Uncharacterized protein n=1 Tax=Streptomyces avermitilis TaxID=33903 RepID=A0A499VMM9_STRAX|nr:hypothetical protein SAVMC3_01060 [Streptomyces avermitilis]